MTDRSSRAGAVLWLGFFAASAIVLSSIALLGPTLSAWLRNSPPEPDCRQAPRYAQWRSAFQSTSDARGPERVRRGAAAYLIKCRTLHGATKRTVLARLGDALPSEGSKAERRRHLEYPLGLDGLGLDTETLLMGFDRHGRLASIDAGAD